MPILWHDKEDERMTSEMPQENAQEHKMDSTQERNINRFFMFNHPSM